MKRELGRLYKEHTDLFIAGGIVVGGGVLLGTATLAALALAPKPAPAQTPLATSTAPNAYANVHLIAESAVVYDLKTGDTLYAQDADHPLPLPSLTKLIPLYAATGVLQNASPVTIT